MELLLPVSACGDGWDLEAVVRGYISRAASSATLDIKVRFDSFTNNPDLMSSTARGPGFPVDFPGFCETAMLLDDDSNGVHNPSMLSTFHAAGVSSRGNAMEVNGVRKLQGGDGSSVVVAAPVGVDAVRTTAKYKRRKNQQKPVVRHVTADGISSDPWAWRKYGQKPIKGSPFPRSYYRCSSSKGCIARKQVERSTSEPGMFTVTYTGDHSHSHPTRRSALAGITRSSKFTKKPTAMTSIDQFLVHAPRLPQEITAGHSNGSSPTSTASVEEGECSRRGTPVWGESGNDDNVLQLPRRSLVLGEEIILGFDELEGFGMDFALINCC